MKLLTKEILKKFPGIKETEGKAQADIQIVAKFFTPWSNWTWYAYEFDGQDEFFGLVVGFEKEFGYFSLSELEAIKGPFGLGVERDRNFSATLAEVKEKEGLIEKEVA